MKLQQLREAPKPKYPPMSDQERHEYLGFMDSWLNGSFMRKQPQNVLTTWETISRMFPPRIATPEVTLYRLVTLDIKYAKAKTLNFNPAPGRVRRWSSRLIGLDPVMGVSTDVKANTAHEQSITCRLGIEANIPSELVLATTASIRKAFMTLRHDYFERYPEKNIETNHPIYGKVSRTIYPGYPGGEDALFDMNEIGYYRDVLTRIGGHLRQFEVVVKTPPRINAKVVRVFRVGENVLRQGNDDPHG